MDSLKVSESSDWFCRKSHHPVTVVPRHKMLLSKAVSQVEKIGKEKLARELLGYGRKKAFLTAFKRWQKASLACLNFQ